MIRLLGIGLLAVAVSVTASPYIGHAAKVVIDAGHGGSDPGAVGINGLYEKTVNRNISLILADLLEERGYEVMLTRPGDTSLSLQERVELTKEADLFVSVHANAHPSASVAGSMVLYHDAGHPNPQYPASEEMKMLTPENRRLAQLVLNSMLEQVPNVDRGLVPSSAYVVRMGNIPSILVETAFLSNQSDAQKLADPRIRALYALGIANGIAQYVPPKFRDVAGHWARESILRLNEQGIANGYDGNFYPNRPLTRAELVAIADRAFGLKEKNRVRLAEVVPVKGEDASVSDSVYGETDFSDTELPSPSPSAHDFLDLPEWHWSFGVMNAAVKSGVIQGYPDGTVRPDMPVTRTEAAAVMDRLLQLESDSDANIAFTDITRSNWAYEAIIRLAASGIVQGVSERIFGPNRFVTRAEMATMVDRQLRASEARYVASADEKETATH